MSTAPLPWVVRNLPAGSSPSSPNDLLAGNRPLGAGRAMVEASNLLHMGQENACRHLRSHDGWPSGVWKQTVNGVDPYVNTGHSPDVSSIDWRSGATAGNGVIYLGKFWTDTYGQDARFPSVRMRGRFKVDGGYHAAVLLVATPGVTSPTSHSSAWDAVFSGGSGAPGSSFSTFDLSVDLGTQSAGTPTPASIAPYTVAGTSVAQESGTLYEFSLWVGAYCMSGSTSDKLWVTTLSVWLEPPP